MNSRRSVRRFLLWSGALASVSFNTAPVSAQSAPTATKGVPGISCYLPPLKLSDADILSFLGRSEDDLASFQGAGLPLSTRVRMLAASDVRTLAPILAHVRSLNGAKPAAADSAQPEAGAAPSTATAPGGTPGPNATGTAAFSQPPSSVIATPPGAQTTAILPQPAYLTTLQLTAIAEGLAAASVTCSRIGNELGTMIQEEVVKTGDEAFMQAFVKALEVQNVNQVETAALGRTGAAASPAAAIGNDGQAGPNSGQFGDESIPTTSGEFSVPNGRALYFSDNGSGGSNDPQVSATRP